MPHFARMGHFLLVITEVDANFFCDFDKIFHSHQFFASF